MGHTHKKRKFLEVHSGIKHRKEIPSTDDITESIAQLFLSFLTRENLFFFNTHWKDVTISSTNPFSPVLI